MTLHELFLAPIIAGAIGCRPDTLVGDTTFRVLDLNSVVFPVLAWYRSWRELVLHIRPTT